ncbi:hypothetical protein TNCV_3344861 [Trichonephila clavipes]|nr:hypothetical protein TNCV_3344861 [Trichonephila clavipes]
MKISPIKYNSKKQPTVEAKITMGTVVIPAQGVQSIMVDEQFARHILWQSHFVMHGMLLPQQYTNLAVPEMLPTLAQKPMLMPFWMSDKSLCFCITPVFYEDLAYPLDMLNCTVLLSDFC